MEKLIFFALKVNLSYLNKMYFMLYKINQNLPASHNFSNNPIF